MVSKLPNTGTTIFTKMSALANEYSAVNLSQGFPNFPISEELKSFVKEGLDLEQVQYAPLAGRPDLLAAIGNKISAQHGIKIDAKSEITVTAGATQAIYSAISCLINEGEEVILFDPSYDCYSPTVIYNKGIPVRLKLKVPSFRINWNEVEDRVNKNTRLIIVNNPHNPCGSVWTEEDIRALENLLEKHPQLYVLSDEVYEHIQFQGTHQSVLKSELIRSRSFVTYSFGKTFHVTGWKTGYCVAPKEMTIEFRKHHQFNVFCVNNTMQYALAKYLKSDLDWTEIARSYKRRKELFLAALTDSRFNLLPCDGTYFCLMDYSSISKESDVAFTERLVKENGIALIPISVFYGDGTDNNLVRVCFAKDNETLTRGAELLCKI